jgi:tetratricopeptide (TPR) repeat protein
MIVGIYALAKNEAANVVAWEASSADADVRVVTDTGSTDDTVQMLESRGVTVARGNVIPWRWDDAHNLSMQHLPPHVEVAIRLDMDEVLEPGWRETLEKAWQPETTKLRYWYQWSEALRFKSDRIHTRSGYRWTGATHEGLVRWSGDEVQTHTEHTLIRHHRQPGKQHKTDLALLRQAVAENPHDARMAWYLARELDYHDEPGIVEALKEYLRMPGGAACERAYAYRVLARRQPERAGNWLLRAIEESPHEPEGYLALGQGCWDAGDAVGVLHWARRAEMAPADRQSHTSDPVAYGYRASEMAAAAAYDLGLKDEALEHAREAFRRDATQRNAALVARLELELTTFIPGPKER